LLKTWEQQSIKAAPYPDSGNKRNRYIRRTCQRDNRIGGNWNGVWFCWVPSISLVDLATRLYKRSCWIIVGVYENYNPTDIGEFRL